ncbi:MAG: alpha/beta hydrolase [Gemmatimonadota bacterium]|nr:alpha/beta hydrolase [Gemmatimonadota bacterium]
MAIILNITSLVLTGLVVFVGVVWLFQERIAFQPPRSPRLETVEASRVSYKARDGQPLLAYIVGDPKTATGLLLSFHGNADLAINGIDWAKEVNRATGFAVMLTEYRGYMNLGGRPTYRGSQLDSEAAYEFARGELGVSADRIAIYGHSLGSAIATELAARHRPLALLLESPFTSARAMSRIIGWRAVHFVWDAIARFHFDTVAKVAAIDAPVSVAHGARDRIIPPQMGNDVFAAAKVKGELLLVPEASHNDVAYVAGPGYWRWISAALQK